jgi:hypothetical protein
MEKEKNLCVNEKIALSKTREHILFKSIKSPKNPFWKFDKCCYKQRKAMWIRINYICEHKYCVNPKGKCVIVLPHPHHKCCCFLLFGFSYEAVHLHCQPTKALFHGGTHTKDMIWRNSEVCTNSEYTWIVQTIVWTLNPYEWKPRAQQLLSLECTFAS